MKLYGFRPKSDEEREQVERAMEGFPSTDAFVREAVLAYIHPELGPAATNIIDAADELEDLARQLRRKVENGGP